ncbi:MAG: DUF1972 domain-containing protein [Actinobacteria bacterium]|nr:DUF1972 domain-containing protein [Actinomycetota bacterium]
MPTVRILGTHGVPAAYGGFETAAEHVGKFLAGRGWDVVVYCQADGKGPITEDTWEGLRRVHIPVHLPGWRGTSLFDLRSVRHASRHRDLCLVFGYNTGIFNTWQRLRRIPLVINMDGIEWSRARWGFFRQAILYVNERIAALVGNRLIADHPEIEVYLRTRAPARKIAMITYGADAVTTARTGPVTDLGLEPGGYLTLVCRPIPENSILELVTGFSAARRDHQLVVVGGYDPSDPYHAEVLAAASDQVLFPGSIYEPERLRALRLHSAMYLHGHTVGGTNPSLVEAMAAGNAVLAHDNPYNRWVAGEGAVYFRTAGDVADRLDEVLSDPERLAALGRASRERHGEEFTWEHVAGQYEELLLEVLAASGRDEREQTRMTS